MTEADYPQVQAILQAGMDTGEATYERKAPEWEAFTSNRLMNLAYVAEESDTEHEPEILGWVTASPISHREVFKGVIEDSIYVSENATGKGVAGRLLDHLLKSAAEQGYWAMHSHIFPDNVGSMKLHESRGFTPVGVLHSMSMMEYGPKAGTWRDNMLMEIILEGGPAWEAYQNREEEDRTQPCNCD
ncbi:GNAT family N-acetyltransferase [Corynebacterium sp. 4HC-13]|uniref:GNAT family N-acetyltransferase n=2 Tax=Corynebacterium anserum TaxID=2684406 RepID=A0A7G7YR67_9CORY|nr:GNAT family N-acetyltransferase [Corynebacterium anserum]QNH96987.1 GNAT family N-acetyltransferase [Corynebacterium anserum]